MKHHLLETHWFLITLIQYEEIHYLKVRFEWSVQIYLLPFLVCILVIGYWISLKTFSVAINTIHVANDLMDFSDISDLFFNVS